MSLRRLGIATAMALPVILLLAPLVRVAARVRGDRQPPEGRTNPEIGPIQHTPRRHGGILLRLESAFYRLILVPLIAFLPARLAYGIARLHGDWRYRMDSSKREEILRCLESVLEDQLSLAERTRVARDFFRLRSCMPVDVTRLAGRGRALARLVEIRGLEHIEAALAAGRGAILCSAHFGNYNCGLSLIGARGFPVTVIARSVSNTVDNSRTPLGRFLSRLVFQKKLARYRRRPNIEPLGQMEVAFKAATILRQNELIATAIDAPLRLPADRARGGPVDFLNGQVLLLPGATTIAQLMGTPVLMTFMRRSADWRHQVLEISPPIALEGDAMSAFKRCLAAVEAAIRQNPAHWHYWNLSDLVALGLLSDEAMN